jgi:hypothetical protein
MTFVEVNLCSAASRCKLQPFENGPAQQVSESYCTHATFGTILCFLLFFVTNSTELMGSAC